MKRILFTLLIGCSFLSVSCQGPKYKSVSVDEFVDYIKDADKVTLLDVRTPQEFAEGCIPNTDYNIDVLEDNFIDVAQEKLPTDKPVALYCRSGNRSKNAAKLLTEAGYEVVELSAGIRGWIDAGNKVKKVSGKKGNASQIKDFITKMYNEGLYNDYAFLRKHCSKSLLKKLANAYEYVSDDVEYSVWMFRSGEQDGKPGTDEETKILEIKEDGKWYTYKALDMGWEFTKRIKVTVKGDKITIEDLASVK